MGGYGSLFTFNSLGFVFYSAGKYSHDCHYCNYGSNCGSPWLKLVIIVCGASTTTNIFWKNKLTSELKRVLHNLKWHTLTSGQDVEVKSQSGHLKVLGSKCALLWFSMSERPWKDSMHILQENLLVLRLGELTAEGEAGASLLSWQEANKQTQSDGRETQCGWIFSCQSNWSLAVTSTCCRTPSGSAEVR